MKTCTKCKELKSIEEFAINRTKADGRSPSCKECKRSYNKDYYKNNYDAERVRLKKRQEDQWQILDNFFRRLKTKCSRCDESRYAALDFHHKDPSTKEITVAEAFRRNWNIERVKKEIEKCEILCANCHRVEHTNVGSSSSG